MNDIDDMSEGYGWWVWVM